MRVDSFRHPRASAQTALALLTAAAHGDDESRFRILAGLTPDEAMGVLTAMTGVVVGGWPHDAEMPIAVWLVEVGKRLPNLSEELPLT